MGSIELAQCLLAYFLMFSIYLIWRFLESTNVIIGDLFCMYHSMGKVSNRPGIKEKDASQRNFSTDHWQQYGLATIGDHLGFNLFDTLQNAERCHFSRSTSVTVLSTFSRNTTINLNRAIKGIAISRSWYSLAGTHTSDKGLSLSLSAPFLYPRRLFSWGTSF